MFQLLWFGRKSLTNKLSIYVKSNTGSTLSVNLDPKWDIKEVKEVIAPKLGMSPEEVKIILAGKELDDSTVIEVYYILMKRYSNEQILNFLLFHFIIDVNIIFIFSCNRFYFAFTGGIGSR